MKYEYLQSKIFSVSQTVTRIKYYVLEIIVNTYFCDIIYSDGILCSKKINTGMYLTYCML
jgi:hypothetical protein